MPEHREMNMREYINKYSLLAMSEMKRSGIPASITLAQGIIESNYGRSRLAREGNNHFGIKCHNGWTGRKIFHDDDKRNECFRKYNNPDESYIDHSDFLMQGSRYRFLFSLRPGDYRSWARGLKKAGYATNARYADMLIDMIENNNLHVYDEMVFSGKDIEGIYAGSNATGNTDSYLAERNFDSREPGIDNFTISRKSRVEVRNRIDYIRVREGDTFSSLQEEFDLLGWELRMYNELGEREKLEVGRLLYLQPKRSKAARGNDFHIVKEGETMYSISQLYGIKLKALYKKNRMEPGNEPLPGTELWLRKLKPKGL